MKQGLFFFIVAPESAILERQFCSVPDSRYLSVLISEHTVVSLMALMADLAGGLQPKQNTPLQLESIWTKRDRGRYG